MKDHKKLISDFVEKWKDNDDHEPQSEESIKAIENHFSIKLPGSYRFLLTKHGNVSTQKLPGFVLNTKKYLPDILWFYNANEVIEKTDGNKEALQEKYVCIAPLISDGFLCLSTDDCKEQTVDMPVYVYSYDHGKTFEFHKTFIELIALYNRVPKRKPEEKSWWQFWK
jgi:hypothetical protein